MFAPCDNFSSIFLPDPVNRNHTLNGGRASWHLALPNITGGNAFYNIAGMKHGTLTNGVGWGDTQRGGGYGQINLDGVDDYVLSANAIASTDNFAFAIWANLSAYATVIACAATIGNAAADGYIIAPSYVGNGNNLTFLYGGVGFFNTSMALTFGTWYRIMFQSRGGTPLAYVNGLPVATTPTGGTSPVAPTGSTYLGSDNFGNYMAGAVDDFCVWNRSLTDVEVQEDYNLSRRGYPDVLNRVQPFRPDVPYRIIRHNHKYTRETLPDFPRVIKTGPTPKDDYIPGIKNILPRIIRPENFDIDLRPRPRIMAPRLIDYGARQAQARGLYRTFSTAEYRFYLNQFAPPQAGDIPLYTNASLNFNNAPDILTVGDWWISVSYFNGVLDSGFFPIGSAGETYIKLTVTSLGVTAPVPPSQPQAARLEALAGGVVRLVAFYAPIADGDNAATEWAVSYSVDGATPPSGLPTFTRAFGGGALQPLSYLLPAQIDGTVVKVQLQVRRGTVYSDPISILSISAKATGPTAPLSLQTWAGQLPEVSV